MGFIPGTPGMRTDSKMEMLIRSGTQTLVLTKIIAWPNSALLMLVQQFAFCGHLGVVSEIRKSISNLYLHRALCVKALTLLSQSLWVTAPITPEAEPSVSQYGIIPLMPGRCFNGDISHLYLRASEISDYKTSFVKYTFQFRMVLYLQKNQGEQIPQILQTLSLLLLLSYISIVCTFSQLSNEY